ncbi:unnamed protein product, partial [Rotaria sp. Silwood1]
LYCSLVFTCHCSNEIKINTSKQCPKTSKQDINIRSAIGHQNLLKLCGVLNVPPPIDDDHSSRTITHILPVFESHKLNSMKNAIEEARSESNKRKFTVSGYGTWPKRGFSSLHGIVEIMSTGSSAKVLDLERLSKSCSIFTGALSSKHSNPTKYEEIKNKHKCEINHSSSSKTIDALLIASSD